MWSDKSIVSNATMLVNENKNVLVIKSPLIFHFRKKNIIHAFEGAVKTYHMKGESSDPIKKW